MNKETFDKYFNFDEKKKTLSIISNIVAEEIMDYDVDDYVKSNYNSDMTSLFVDKNVANISKFIMGQHFFLNVDVDRDNCFFQSFNNCLLSKDSSEMYYCELPLKKKDFVIPKGVKRIMPYCFFFEDYYFDYGQIKLKNIICNDELLEIKGNAFRGSYNGQTLFINNKLENIKEDSFNCHGLKFNIGENKNFKNENGIITFKDIVLSVESSEVLCNLQNLLKKCSSGIYGTILNAIYGALLDIANDIDSNEAKMLKKYLLDHNGVINSKDTLLAYFGESDCLKIPEGIKNVYMGYQGKSVKQLYIPASLQNIDLIKSGYGPATSRLFIGIENIFVDKMNKNFYANKYFLYNIKKNEVIYNMIKDKEVVIDDPVITNINDILRFTPVETIIFNNDFLLTINGQLGRRHSCVRDVVFNSSKIIFSDDIFNGMTTIEHIFVREEDFAKNLFERIPRQYKDKIFCLCEDDVNESIMFYRNNKYRLFKNKTIQKRTVDKRTSLLHYIKETPTFTRYSIAEFLSCTPATALNFLKIMVKDKVLSESDFENEKKRAKAQERIKAEKKVFELLTGKSVNMDELVNMLDPSEKQSHFYSSLIWKLIRANAIIQETNQGYYSKLSLGNKNEFFEKIQKCKTKILRLLEEHRILITIGEKLSIDDCCDYITERALNELVCENIVEISDQFEEGRGWLTYYKNLQNKDFSDVKPFEIKYHHISLSEQRELNAAEVVKMCKKIMEILPKKRITRSDLEKAINYDEENDRFFFHALESLNSQGAINFNISTVNRKKSYLEWQNEISKIKEFILQSFKDKDFVSRDFLIYSTNDKFKCLYAIEELIAEKKIVETREKSDLVGGITAYRLV